MQRLPDLASRALGGSVLFTNDDFFADVHQLIAPEPPRHDRVAFGPRGKIYDGWETRRRRAPAPPRHGRVGLGPGGKIYGGGEPRRRGARGEDFVIVRLGVPGIVRGGAVDPSHSPGNSPPQASVAATTVLGYPTADDV